MQALGDISHSINDLLQPANAVTAGYGGMGAPGDSGDLGGYGDFYTVRDMRKRSRKEPGDVAANKNLQFTKDSSRTIQNFDKDLYLAEQANPYNFDKEVNGKKYVHCGVNVSARWQDDTRVESYYVNVWFFSPRKKNGKNTFKGYDTYVPVDVKLSDFVNLERRKSSEFSGYVLESKYKEWFNEALEKQIAAYQRTIRSGNSFAAENAKDLKYLVEYYSNIDKYTAYVMQNYGDPTLLNPATVEEYKRYIDPSIFDGITLGITANDALCVDSLDGTVSAPFGISCLGNLATGSDLGKPTIKFEFETNSELADFLKDTQKAAEFAETINPEGAAKTAADVEQPTRRRRNQKAITTDTPLSLMPGGMTPGLPPSPTSPKALPPSNIQPAPGLPSFNKVFENPDGIYFDERRIGDYGTINDNLRYINLYIDKNYSIGRNIFNYAEKIFPNAVVIVCFVANDGKWKFYLERNKYQDAVRKYLPNFYVNGVPKYIVIDDIPSIERLVKAFEADGKNVVFIYRNIVDNINDVPSTPAALPPASTPDIVVPSNPNAFNTPDWDTIYKLLYDSYHWNSFDPENSANYTVKEFKNYYSYALDRLPEDRKKDFTTKFVNYIYEIARLNAAAPSAAVTGRGGVSAKQAAKYNAANDRYMEKRAYFTDWIKNYIDTANRIDKKQTFAAMSQDQKEDARFEEIKKNVDYFAALLRNRAQVPSYSITNARQNLQTKIENEAYKGNVELVERLLEYMRPLNVYTNRSSVWTLADVARKKREKHQENEKQFEEQNNAENTDYQVYFDTNEDRVKIYFDSIPSEEIRTWLKSHNFKWSPRNKAWQRQITNDSRYVVNKFNQLYQSGVLKGLGKPTIKLEFENNGELLSLFDAETINGDKEPAAIFNCPESQLDCKGYRPTYKILPSYDHLIDPADGQSKLVGYGFEDATLSELIEACKYYRQVARLAQHLKDSDALQTAFNIWHFLHTNVRYNYDAPGLEEIRVPARVWADRFSGVDCDCLAVFTACLLLNLGYRPQFEIVGFDNSPKYSHIYVTLDGYPIDRVLPSFLDRPKNITKTKIMDIPVYQLSGCDLHGGLSGIYDSTLRRIATGTASAQDCLNFRKAQVLVSLQGNNPDAATLAEILMPYVGVVGDDGAYYFTNANVAKVATEADSELRQMQSQNLAGAPLAGWFDIVRQKVKAASEDVIINNPQCNAPTIVVIINPKREKVQVKGEMVKADLPSVNPLQSEPALFTATLPESEAADEAPAEKKGSNVLWWALGVVGLTTAAVCMNEKKEKKK